MNDSNAHGGAMRTLLFLMLTCFAISSYAASKVTCYFPNFVFTASGAVIINVYNYRITADNGKNYYVPINNCIIEW